MAHAHNHFGAEKVVRGETPHASADMNVTPLIDVLLVLLDHLHGRPAADAEGRRHQPAARDQGADGQPSRTRRSCSSTRPIADSRSTTSRSRSPSSRPSSATSSRPARRRRCSSPATATLRYGDIVAVIDAAKGAGIEKVGIVTEEHAQGRKRVEDRRQLAAPLAAPAHTIKGGPSRVRPFRLFRLPTALQPPTKDSRSFRWRRPAALDPPVRAGAFPWPWRIRRVPAGVHGAGRTGNRPPGMPAARETS